MTVVYCEELDEIFVMALSRINSDFLLCHQAIDQEFVISTNIVERYTFVFLGWL